MPDHFQAGTVIIDLERLVGCVFGAGVDGHHAICTLASPPETVELHGDDARAMLAELYEWDQDARSWEGIGASAPLGPRVTVRIIDEQQGRAA